MPAAAGRFLAATIPSAEYVAIEGEDHVIGTTKGIDGSWRLYQLVQS